MTAAADRHLLFGLLALQNGLIDQGQLVAAFQAWTRDKARSLADQLLARGDLTPTAARLDALAALHLEAHDGDVEKSLAAVPANRSTRASLAELGEPEIEATLARVTRTRMARPPSETMTPTALRPWRSAGPPAMASGSACSGLMRRRAGRGVRRPGCRAAPRGGAEADHGEARRRPGQPPAVRRRGRDHRGTGAPGHRAGLRCGHHRRRTPLLRHAVHQGREPQGGHRALPPRRHAEEPPRPPLAGTAQAAPPLPRRLQRHRLRPFPRRDPSRFEAGEHHPGQARRDAGGRLGTGQGHRPGGPVGRRADDRAVVERIIGDAARQRAWARRPT